MPRGSLYIYGQKINPFQTVENESKMLVMYMISYDEDEEEMDDQMISSVNYFFEDCKNDSLINALLNDVEDELIEQFDPFVN